MLVGCVVSSTLAPFVAAITIIRIVCAVVEFDRAPNNGQLAGQLELMFSEGVSRSFTVSKRRILSRSSV